MLHETPKGVQQSGQHGACHGKSTPAAQMENFHGVPLEFSIG